MVSLPLVSVVVPVYNASSYIRQTLSGILCQTYQPIEVIVVDDGSTDASPNILGEYGERIILIRQHNQGVCIARNAGIARSRGEYVALCDSDDIWLPDKLERQMKIAMKYPKVGIIACAFESIDAMGQTLPRPSRKSALHNRPISLQAILLREGNVIGISTAVVKREILEITGGFEARYSVVRSKDYDLWVRASDYTEFYILSTVLAQYRVLKDSMIHGSLKKEYKPQFQWLRIYRNRYSTKEYNIRRAKIYADWAESSFCDREDISWKLLKKAIKLNPMCLKYQVRLVVEIVKYFIRMAIRFFSKLLGSVGRK
ncbi:MAG: glycosyltransferase [Nitrospira sp.]|nr:glycosyltransferase [Nitrospira sp.]